MKILDARPADCQSIANIYNYYLGTGTMDLEEKTSKYYKKQILNLSPNERLYVGVVNGNVIAWGNIKKYSDRMGYFRAGETSVYLHPDQRNKGYGKKLKLHIMQMCRKLGYKHLVAKIWADNEVSITYNKKLGYEIVGTQKQIGYVNGQWIDVVIMQYIFE